MFNGPRENSDSVDKTIGTNTLRTGKVMKELHDKFFHQKSGPMRGRFEVGVDRSKNKEFAIDFDRLYQIQTERSVRIKNNRTLFDNIET